MTELDFDVLRVICGLLTNVPAVLSFSLTCSTLHPVAVERRLSMRAVTIHSAESVRDLHKYIFVDEKRRGQHIRAITIPFSDMDPNSSEELVDRLLAVFESASHVRTFSLYVPGSGRHPSLFRDPKVLAAVSNMPRLQELGVVASAGQASELLLSNRCRALKTFRHSDMPVCARHRRDSHIPLLRLAGSPLTSTLEEMELTLDLLEMAAQGHVSFPAVRSVTLTNVEDIFLLDMLLTVFPNLDRTLIIREAEYIYISHRVAYLRGKNREVAGQKTLAQSTKPLDRVAASADILYALGLARPIRHLTLSMRWNDDHEPQASATTTSSARALFHEHAPTHLALVDVRLPHGFSNLDSMLFPEDAVVPRVTHLVLDATYKNTTISYDRNDPIRGVYGTTNASWDAVLDAPLAGLEALQRLTHIRIVVNCEVDLGASFCAPIHDGARSFEFDRLVAALPGIVPSLTHIFITSCGCTYTLDGRGRRRGEETWGTSRGWRVQRRPCDGRGSQGKMHDMEELSGEDAEAVIEREELRATDRKEWVAVKFGA